MVFGAEAVAGEPEVPPGDPFGGWAQRVAVDLNGDWQVLVDLSTHGEPVSDLTLHAKIFEGNDPRLEVYSVHVP